MAWSQSAVVAGAGRSTVPSAWVTVIRLIWGWAESPATSFDRPEGHAAVSEFAVEFFGAQVGNDFSHGGVSRGSAFHSGLVGGDAGVVGQVRPVEH